VKAPHLDHVCREKRILIFSQVSAARDSTSVLERLAVALRSTRIDHVIFTTYDPQQIFDVSTSGLSTCLFMVPANLPAVLSSNPVDLDRELFTSIWQRYQPNSTVSYEPGVTAALDAAREIGRRAGSMQTLITGSLHLAGAVLFSFSNRETV
jgi:folylpolyglutamate synthase